MASIVGGALASYLFPKAMKAIGLKKGGKVQKEGLYHLHKGEIVVPAAVVNRKAPKTKMTAAAARKGARSKTRPGDMDFTTKRGDKVFHRGGKNVKAKRKPYKKR